MTSPQYTHPIHLQFIQDMQPAGLEVRHYRGRFFWQGPAVVSEYLNDALDQTQVRCQWDQLGLGYIVYPLQGMEPGDPEKYRLMKAVEVNYD